MNQYCVVVANGARARFFTLETPEFPDLESGPNLIEKQDLVNTERELPEREIWSETKSGRNRAANGGPSHGYDDHRSQHEDEYERRFAHNIAEQCSILSKKHNATGIVLVSQQRLLSHLRTAIDSKIKDIPTQELAKDLSKLNPIELHQYLAKVQLLPKRKTPHS